MSNRVCILDYGSGNVQSVFNMLASLGYDSVISNKKEDIEGASHLILPGVGAFGVAMSKIKETIPMSVLIQEVLERRKPFLGICVGMQVLAEKGYEFGEHEGLGWIKGEVKKMNPGKQPLPHVGWNDLQIVKKEPMFESMGEKPDFYFVHSYHFECRDEKNISAYAEYGGKFVAAVNNGNIHGVQFHPEKSQRAGKMLLSNFLKSV